MGKVTIVFLGVSFFGVALVEYNRFKRGEREAIVLAIPAFILYFLLAVLIVLVEV